MAYHRGVARDTAGNSLNESSVSVLEPGTTTAASLFSDEALTTSMDNPITTDVDGVYEFYTKPGYYDIQVVKTGFTTVTIENQAIGTPFAYLYADAAGTATKDGTGHDIDNNWGTLNFAEAYPSNAFSMDANGKLDYDGLPTVYAVFRAVIVLRATVDISFSPYFSIGGVTYAQVAHKLQGTGEDQTVSFSTVQQITTGDKLFLGCEFSGGPADVTIQEPTSIEVQALG